MRKHKILYFSTNPNHIELFHGWAKGRIKQELISWYVKDFPCAKEPSIDIYDLPRILEKQNDLDCLYVIIDYLSLFKSKEELNTASEIVRRVIIQYPEIDILFDQSGVDESWITGIEFLLGQDRESECASKIAQGFHVFQNNTGCILQAELDYDNLFDGSNLRWAVKNFYYDSLNVKKKNFERIQNARQNSLAIVVDDEPRQSRFNGFALYVLGFRVLPAHTARMLLALNDCIENDCPALQPSIIVRDFDLQFPDAREGVDYEGFNYLKAPCFWDKKWEQSIHSQYHIKTIREDSVAEPFFEEMIDYIRDYRYYEDGLVNNENGRYGNRYIIQIIDLYSSVFLNKDKIYWKITPKNTFTSFWCRKLKQIPTFFVTNGYDKLNVKSKIDEGWWEVKKYKLVVQGMYKPVSGLYHPFFTDLKGKREIKTQFVNTRYREGVDDYEINKKRKNHEHGVPLDVYDTVMEMQKRAEQYYEEKAFVKAAVLAQEIVELLNGFHYQMMIRAYHLKAKAENAIAMNVIGADENQLVLDAMERVKYIKEDVQRMVYPQYKGEKNIFRDYITQCERLKQEHQILGHIFSDCRTTCHNNEYFMVEAVFIREMAFLDERDYGFQDIWRYIKHIYFMYRKTLKTKK